MTKADTVSDPRTVDQPEPTDDEHDVMRRLQDDLAARYPAIPATVIADHVHRAAARFDQAPVRDYLSVLITRAVRAELDAAGHQPQP